MTLLPGGEVVDAGVDWITATAKESETCEAILSIGEEAVASQEASGWLGNTAGWQGYRGYGVDGCFYGTRADGACLRVSGSTAHRLATAIHATGAKVTRLDLQATVQLPQDDATYARRLLDEWRGMQRGGTRNAKLSTKCVDSGLDGSTAYFGERNAARFTRVYDKHRESSGQYPSGCFRVEVEYKRRLANPTFRYFCNGAVDRGRVLAAIAGHCGRLGLAPGFRVPEVIDTPIVTRVTPDVERLVAWLESTVRPVVKKLYEAGYHAEATEALYGWLRTAGPLDD